MGGNAVTLFALVIIFFAGLTMVSDFIDNGNEQINDSSPLSQSFNTSVSVTEKGTYLGAFSPLIVGAGLILFALKKL